MASYTSFLTIYRHNFAAYDEIKVQDFQMSICSGFRSILIKVNKAYSNLKNI